MKIALFIIGVGIKMNFLTYLSPVGINASRGLGEVTNYVDGVTNHWFGTMLLLTIYVIILIGVYKAKDDVPSAIAIAGFVTFVIGLLFWMGNMLSGGVFAITIGIAIVGAMVLWADKR